jgi:hypothetical protein
MARWGHVGSRVGVPFIAAEARTLRCRTHLEYRDTKSELAAAHPPVAGKGALADVVIAAARWVGGGALPV